MTRSHMFGNYCGSVPPPPEKRGQPDFIKPHHRLLHPFSALMVQFWYFVLAPILFLVGGAEAQATTNATCLPQYNVLNNNLGQNPCLMSAYLLEVCTPPTQPGQEFEIFGLPNATVEYAVPTPGQANPCLCSSVPYSLLSACALCQGGQYHTWSEWIVNCPSNIITVGAYPETIPGGTTIPKWAYQNITTSGTFDPDVAIPPPKAAGSSGLGGGAIAGIVIGAVAFLAIIGGLVFYFIRRRRNPVQYEGNQPPMEQSEIGYSVQVAPTSTPRIYDPDDPSTYPGSTRTPRLYDPDDPSTFPSSPDNTTVIGSSDYSGLKSSKPVEYKGFAEA